MTRAPPRRLRMAPMREDSRSDCIERLSFLFLLYECFLELPTGERCIRLPWLGSVASIATNHQQCRCHVSHLWGERPRIRRAFVARKEEHDGSRPRVCQDFIPPLNQFSYNENASRESSYFRIDASRVRRSGPCQLPLNNEAAPPLPPTAFYLG